MYVIRITIYKSKQSITSKNVENFHRDANTTSGYICLTN